MSLRRRLRSIVYGCLAGLLLSAALSSSGVGVMEEAIGFSFKIPRFLGIAPAMGQTVQLISNAGWLEIQRLRGDVSIQTSRVRPATVGDRLTRGGDRLITGARSLSVLLLDNNIGTVQVAQNSVLSVRQLGITRSGGWLTTLNLDQGQVRFRINKEKMPRNSRFEVHSPSGVAGVRGTEFGIMLNPANRMVIGTEEGLVEAESGGQMVSLPPEMGSAIFPNEPPLPPLPLDRQLNLDLQELDYREDGLWLSGTVYPLNTVFANGIELLVSKTGVFEQTIPYDRGQELVIKVANSVGEDQGYQFLGLERDVE